MTLPTESDASSHSLLQFLSTRMLLPTIFTFIFYIVTTIVYRLTLHPLSSIPGPKLAAVTRLYEAYYDVVLGGQYIFKIAKLHKQYGPILRISPSEIHISAPSFHPHLYNRSGPWNKDAFSYFPLAAEGTGWRTAIASMEHFSHKRRRAALNPFFSKPSISSKLPIVIKNISRLTHSLDLYTQSGKVMGIGAAFSAVTGDIAHELVLGEESWFLDGEEVGEVLLEANVVGQELWQAIKHVPGFLYLYMVFFIVRYFVGRTPEAAKAILRHHKEKMARTKALYNQYHDPNQAASVSKDTLVHHLLTSPSLPASEKDFPRINAEVSLIIGAGMETVATTLRILIYHIYSKPDVLHRLRQELTQIPPSDKPTETLRHLETLPYLTATISEGLRFNPGAISRLGRIAPDRDIVFDDGDGKGKYVIPAGYTVSMSNYLMHMDESIYPEPERFQLERWLDTTDPARRKAMEGAYAPFSKGTRNCVGMHLAYAELYFILGMIVPTYDLRFEGTQASDVECGSDRFTMGTRTKNGVKVRVEKIY